MGVATTEWRRRGGGPVKPRYDVHPDSFKRGSGDSECPGAEYDYQVLSAEC